MISRTTAEFWRHFDKLPEAARRQAVRAYGHWRANPAHPGLHFKCISERHAVFSVRVGIHWRALGYRDVVPGDDMYTWFWIGSHAEYDRLIADL